MIKGRTINPANEVTSIGMLDESFVTLFKHEKGWQDRANKWAEKHGAEFGKYYIQRVQDACVIVCFAIKDKQNAEPTKA